MGLFIGAKGSSNCALLFFFWSDCDDDVWCMSRRTLAKARSRVLIRFPPPKTPLPPPEAEECAPALRERRRGGPLLLPTPYGKDDPVADDAVAALRLSSLPMLL